MTTASEGYTFHPATRIEINRTYLWQDSIHLYTPALASEARAQKLFSFLCRFHNTRFMSWSTYEPRIFSSLQPAQNSIPLSECAFWFSTTIENGKPEKTTSRKNSSLKVVLENRALEHLTLIKMKIESKKIVGLKSGRNHRRLSRRELAYTRIAIIL